MPSVRLVLVDGMSVAYRAFYAIRNLSTNAGRPTNAVFGFIRMIRQLRSEWQATHWAVFFDGGLPEERVELLEEYKAQRPPMPDDLMSQLPLIEQFLDASGIAWVRQEGQEADDLMASVVAWAESEADSILLATHDKDLYQLVNERVGVIPVSGKGSIMDREAVHEKTGVFPEAIPAWLALVGDSSDNIPGVPGIGPKTASALLTQFGSLENVWKGLAGVEREKTRRALEAHRDTVERNLAMVVLRRDLPCALSWEDLAVAEGDPSQLLALFEELEFASLAREAREQTLF